MHKNNFLILVSTQSLSQQTYGLGLAPKRSLNVMQGEIARVYQLSRNMITPLPYIVPRKVCVSLPDDLSISNNNKL